MNITSPQPMYSRRQIRHLRGWQGCLLVWFVMMLIGGFVCVASMAAYIFFPVEPFQLLVLGLDSRGSEGYVSRTDSIMLIGFQPAHIGILSIPRDLFIDVPDYGLQRINTINMLGEMEESGAGPDLVARSIQQNFGVEVDAYLRLDFQAFVALVDAIGGIDVDVPDYLIDYQFPTDDYGTMVVEFQPGWQHMDGTTALIYARTRYADDDYKRAERQQRVVQAVALKLINPLHWLPAFAAVQSHIDTNLSIGSMIAQLPAILINFNDFNMLVINREYIAPGDGYSMPDYNRLNSWVEEYLK